uniref:Uncharacterized protein n=1 Tax=Meloidogyne hapla TaxID=6305 RepID=A0A1I8B6Z7_MELHA
MSFEGGIRHFDNFNKTWPFIQNKMEKITFLQLLPAALIESMEYLIIFICAFKMIKYVNSHTGFDGNMKRLNKLLTKVLIILVRNYYFDWICNYSMVGN